MNIWQRFVDQPIAAVRPWLFQHIFLVMVTIDLWLTFIPRAGRLGIGGFDVAHFQWLDAIQPVPTPGLYVFMMIVCSFIFWIIAWCGMMRLLLTAGCALYTYGWMMSQSDSFQHHYMMSLMLFCLIFFPRAKVPRERGVPSPRINASAYVMLGALIGIVYFWTTIAKIDDVWTRGAVVQLLIDHDTVHPVLATVTAWMFQVFGEDIWKVLAIGTIVLEITLAVGYLYALGQDNRTSRLSRWVCITLWLCAVALHVGILLMPLSIGLFGWYMLACGTVFLLPANWLEFLQRVVMWPIGWVKRWAVWGLNPWNAPMITVVQAVLIGAGLVWMGVHFDLPGAHLGMAVTAGLFLAMVGWALRKENIPAGQRMVLVTLLFLVTTTAITVGIGMTQRIHRHIAHMQHYAGDPHVALTHYVKVYDLHPDSLRKHALANNIGDVYMQLGNLTEAIDWYYKALEFFPDDIFAHANLGLSLSQVGRYEEAIEHYRIALEAGVETAMTHYNFAIALHQHRQIEEAIEHYHKALELDPTILEAHHNIAAALIAVGRRTEARHHLREALRIHENDASTLNDLAWLLATDRNVSQQDAIEAVRLAGRAVTLTGHTNPVTLGTFAEACHAAGLHDEAVRAAELAIQVARAQDADELATQIEERLERYRQGRR